jgi:hypothetical protein
LQAGLHRSLDADFLSIFGVNLRFSPVIPGQPRAYIPFALAWIPAFPEILMVLLIKARKGF